MPRSEADGSTANGSWEDAISSSSWRWSDTIDASRLSNLTYISHGTFAVVYRAELAPAGTAASHVTSHAASEGPGEAPPSRSRSVALKVLRPAQAGRPGPRMAFLRELAVHRLLKHR